MLPLTLLLRYSTGPSDMPSVQQQQRQPQIRHFKLKGMLLYSTELTLSIVA